MNLVSALGIDLAKNVQPFSRRNDLLLTEESIPDC